MSARIEQRWYQRQCTYGRPVAAARGAPTTALRMLANRRGGHFLASVTCQHTRSRHLRGSKSDSMDKAAGSSACWSVWESEGEGKGMGAYAVGWLPMRREEEKIKRNLEIL
jgi:hypothetical protein